MIYTIVKNLAWLVSKLFVRHLSIEGLNYVPKKGAVLLAINHPNSFFDAILVASHLNRPVESLARGDVFRKKWASFLLRQIRIHPIHRLSEGKEHLSENEATFNTCIEIFKQGGVVLIFSEGKCDNQTELLPLRKGTARLVHRAWKENIDLEIVPIGLTYNSFSEFGKVVEVKMTETITKPSFDNVLNGSEGIFLRSFNDRLANELRKLIKPITDAQPKKAIWLFLYFIHFPLIKLLEPIVKKIAAQTFYDSVLFGGLVFTIVPYWWLIWKILSIKMIPALCLYFCSQTTF
jgi:1-acyl-sn-glycerol-3-phosphate acyltransferase